MLERQVTNDRLCSWYELPKYHSGLISATAQSGFSEKRRRRKKKKSSCHMANSHITSRSGSHNMAWCDCTWFLSHTLSTLSNLWCVCARARTCLCACVCASQKKRNGIKWLVQTILQLPIVYVFHLMACDFKKSNPARRAWDIEGKGFAYCMCVRDRAAKRTLQLALVFCECVRGWVRTREGYCGTVCKWSSVWSLMVV